MAGVEIKLKDLSIKEKLSIIESHDKLPKMSQPSVPAMLKISPLLYKLLKYEGVYGTVVQVIFLLK